MRDTSFRMEEEGPALSYMKIKHSRALTHRRNSGGELPPNVAGASRLRTKPIHEAKRCDGKPEACPTLRIRNVKHPRVALRASTNAVSGFRSNFSTTASG